MKKKEGKRVTASSKFVIVLAIISIIGFLGIVSKTLIGVDIDFYIEALFMFVAGIGMIIEGQITRLREIREEGLTPSNFTHLITVIVGFIAVLAGIFSLPNLRIDYPGFLAVKGILALISIVIIIVQTWIVE